MNKFSQPLLALFLLLIFFTASRAEPYQTIINNGNALNRVDVALLGDGYTAAEMEKYRADALAAMQKFFQQEPFLEYQRYFNVHRIDVASSQSGADHPERNFFVNTAFDAAYNCGNIQRLVCISSSKVNAAVARSLPASHFDIVLVIVNDTEYGGSGGSIAVFSVHQAAVEIALHEVGHSFGLLADEYTGGGPSCNPNVEPPQPNSTRETNRNSIKWRHWIDTSTQIPTFSITPALPGLYQGSSYCDTGLYRPTHNNKMRTLGVSFEQINSEQFVKRIYNFVNPIDAASHPGNKIDISDFVYNIFVTTTKPLTHNLTVNWLADGQVIGSGTLISSHLIPFGTKTLQAVVTDSTTFVRSDPASLLSEIKTWDVEFHPFMVNAVPFDFDGDRRTDISVYRNGVWYLQKSTEGFAGVAFGLSDDKIVPADYDGDAKTDVAVYRGGTWYIMNSLTGFSAVVFGAPDDIPIPADFDGDGKADISVFRPSNGVWYRLDSSTGAFFAAQFGMMHDVPLAADFDGDARADLAVFRTSNGTWYQINSSGNQFKAFQFGAAGDYPLSADFDGDLKTDYAVFRAGTWYVQGSSKGFSAVQFGQLGDIPTTGDYDGDGKADFSVFRPNGGLWFRLNSGSNFSFSAQQFGQGGDKPVPSAFLPLIFTIQND
jgi:hypothetical protein